jgi:hypothetical protein
MIVFIRSSIVASAAWCRRLAFLLLPPERIPFLRNRNSLQDHSLAHILVGEPVATSPGYALISVTSPA